MNKTQKALKYIAKAQIYSDLAKANYSNFLQLDYIEKEKKEKKEQSTELLQSLVSNGVIKEEEKNRILKDNDNKKEDINIINHYRRKEMNVVKAIEEIKQIHAKNNKYKMNFYIQKCGNRNLIYFGITFEKKRYQVSFHTEKLSYLSKNRKKDFHMKKNPFNVIWDNSKKYPTHWNRKSSYETIIFLINNIKNIK